MIPGLGKCRSPCWIFSNNSICPFFFQYYIDTQKYFSNVANNVREWLKGEAIRAKKQTNTDKDHLPAMKIIFSAEHTTNIGFSQYVNMYYFNGTAEIIALNEDKKFRSNFICEQYALKKVIEKLFADYELQYGKVNLGEFRPLQFYFADDMIITGESLHKANNLLQSLIPREYQNSYGTNVFEKCFILIDRFSQSSRKAFVTEPQKNFLSFCKINISIYTHGRRFLFGM